MPYYLLTWPNGGVGRFRQAVGAARSDSFTRPPRLTHSGAPSLALVVAGLPSFVGLMMLSRFARTSPVALATRSLKQWPAEKVQR